MFFIVSFISSNFSCKHPLQFLYHNFNSLRLWYFKYITSISSQISLIMDCLFLCQVIFTNPHFGLNICNSYTSILGKHPFNKGHSLHFSMYQKYLLHSPTHSSSKTEVFSCRVKWVSTFWAELLTQAICLLFQPQFKLILGQRGRLSRLFLPLLIPYYFFFEVIYLKFSIFPFLL